MLLATRLASSVEAVLVAVVLVLIFVYARRNPGMFSDTAFNRDVEKAAAVHGATVGRMPGARGVYFDILGFGARIRIEMQRPQSKQQWPHCQSVVLELPAPVVTFDAPILFTNSATRPCLLRAFERRFKLETDDLETFVWLIPVAAQAELVRLTARLAIGRIHSNGHQIVFRPGVDLRSEIPAVLALFGGIAQRAEALRRRASC